MSYYPSTYTGTDVATDIKRTFGDEAGVQITDSDIIRWIDIGQLEILKNTQILKATSTSDLVAGQTVYSLASLKILKIQAIHVNGSPIPFISFQESEQYVAPNDTTNIASGTPQVWTEWAGNIHLYPASSVTVPGGLSIFYLPAPAKLAQLSDSLSIPDTYYNDLINFVLSKAYELDEDPQNSQFKLGQFTQSLDGMANNENIPQVAYYPVITVLPEDE